MKNKPKNLFFLGPNGTNCEIAANKFAQKFDFKPILNPCGTISKIFEELLNNKKSIAIVPIENSIEGIVRETVDNLLNSDAQILAETSIPICHCLISKGKISDIKTILSHTQAINQCRQFIRDNFSNDIQINPVNSTSFAVCDLKLRDNSYAAIANEFCAKLYGFDVLVNNINDNKENLTRFALLGYGDLNLPQMRTSIAFSTKNEAGALLKILEIFKKFDLNMVYIESRPNKKVLGEYVFFVDIEKDKNSISEALFEVENTTNFLKILGSYYIF